jgi:hypothetical protein
VEATEGLAQRKKTKKTEKVTTTKMTMINKKTMDTREGASKRVSKKKLIMDL